ncbi:MAG: RNA polymerase-associated protein rapA [Magnetococcales bacterium]|nr:RNA polymerase-associated protein rapA [Magnetococcales bacterium]
MKKLNILGVAALVTLLSATPLLADDSESFGEWRVSGVLKNETAFFTNNGPTTGSLQTYNGTTNQSAGEMLKFENSLNLFVNGDISDTTSIHGQFNLVADTEGADGYRYHASDSQNDVLRELYVDTTTGPLDWRIGKQQVVWGTADGIKLLDIVNPTDWREFVQNTTEDARIPVWMIKAEADVGENGNMQFIVAQRKENAIPGMDKSGDPGQPFKMLGVDTITGQSNGFLSIVPALGLVSNSFFVAYGSGAGLSAATGTTVQGYVTASGAAALNTVAQSTNSSRTNLIDGAAWDTNNPNSTFEYMPNATFATFDAFVNATSEYRREYPEEIDPNLGFRYKNSIGNNFNFSLNYLWHYDANPYVDLHWEGTTGQTITTTTTGTNTLTLADSTGAYGGNAGKAANLVFTEKLNRIHSLGTAFDYALDLESTGPVVLRGEFLYDKDTKAPVIDRTKLGYGDLVGAMQSKNADMFKYVLGADFTFFTNLMVSGQFIQFVNLDHYDGDPSSGIYTADATTMHLSNGLKKAGKYKEFGSIFLSKPFGAEQQGRWNNILMVEEGGGYWNRIDVEYAYTDEVIFTSEYNAYFGEKDTMFGQFANSSNLQVGMKYIF